MKRIIKYSLFTALFFTLGIILSFKVLVRSNDDYDGWQNSANIGTIAADPYTRAVVAKSGLLALSRKEAIYFWTNKDHSRREQLSEACDYIIKGGNLPARWWSITLYADDDFLAQNSDEHHSFEATSDFIRSDGTYEIALSAQKAQISSWISSKNAESFSLTLRMYNPENSDKEFLSKIAYPQIIKTKCRGQK